MGALVSWEYVDRFGTDRIRALVDVDMEPSPFQWEDYNHGSNDLDGLRDTLSAVQTDHLAFIDRITEALPNDPPSVETRTLILNEAARTPPPIKSAILFNTLLVDYRYVLPDIGVPTLVCAGRTRSGGALFPSNTPRNSCRMPGSNASKRADTVRPSNNPSGSIG